MVAGKTAAGTLWIANPEAAGSSEGQARWCPAVKIVDWPTMRWRAVSGRHQSRAHALPLSTSSADSHRIFFQAQHALLLHGAHICQRVASVDWTTRRSLTPAEIRELVAYARHPR